MCKIWWQSVQPFSSVPRFLNFWPTKTPQNAPLGYGGANCFSLCPFPDESAGVYQIWCQLVHPFGSYSRFLNFWPPKKKKMPPGGIEGLIVFSLCTFPDESAGVYQIWCQLVHPFGSYSRFFNFWPPKPPQPPLGNTGWFLFSSLPFGDESACVCAKFGPDRTTGDDVYTVGRIHTQTDRQTYTHTLSYIDIDLCDI